MSIESRDQSERSIKIIIMVTLGIIVSVGISSFVIILGILAVAMKSLNL